MIPDNKILRRRCRKNKLKIKKQKYFNLSEEYIFLEDIFKFDETILVLNLFLDMVVYPIYVFVQLLHLEYSPFFIFGLMKSYQLWIDWFRYNELYYEVEEWIKTVKKVGGPWISTNNSRYHIYVYADAMERLSLVTN